MKLTGTWCLPVMSMSPWSTGKPSLWKLWRCASQRNHFQEGEIFRGWQKIWWEQSGKEMVSFGMQEKWKPDTFWSLYKQQRNKVVKEMRKAKGHFFKNFNPSSSKQFWKTVKILNKNNVFIPALVRNGTTVTKDLTRPACLTNTSPNVSTWPNHHFQADMRNLTLVIALVANSGIWVMTNFCLISVLVEY